MDPSDLNAPRQKAPLSFVRLRWVGLSVAAAIPAALLSVLLGYASLGSRSLSDAPHVCYVVPLGGLAMVAAQWFVLRSRVSKPGLWLILSLFGWLGGYLAGSLVGGVIGFLLDPHVVSTMDLGYGHYAGPRGLLVGSPLVGAITGLILGFMQVLGLADEGREVGRGWLFWPMANAVGWGAGFLAAEWIAVNVGASGDELYPIAVAGSFPACGAISALVAAGALGVVLNARIKPKVNPQQPPAR